MIHKRMLWVDLINTSANFYSPMPDAILGFTSASVFNLYRLKKKHWAALDLSPQPGNALHKAITAYFDPNNTFMSKHEQQFLG